MVNRRTLLKGVAGTAAAGAVTAVSKRSQAFAAPAVIAQTGSTVEITYWGSWSGVLGDAEQEVVKRFNESQTDVKVNYQYQGSYEDTAQKLTAALAAKQTPDVSALSDVWWFKFYLNNVIAPLNDLIAANNLDPNDYVDSLWIEGVRKDVQYWIPFARSTPLFYYNKDMYQEAGLEGPPKTWTEFATDMAPKLVKKDGGTTSQYAFAHQTGASYAAWVFLPVAWAFGGGYSTPDFEITINQPATVEAGEFFRKSVEDGWAYEPKAAQTDFENGLVASMLASTGGLTEVEENSKFNVGTAFLPEEKQFGCCTGGAGLSILSASPAEKQQAAFKYIAFATSPEITTYWSQATGYMPVRKSAVTSQAMQDFFTQHPNFKVAVDQLPKTQPQDSARVFIPNGDQIIGKGLEEITLNDREAQSALDDVAKTLTEEAKPVIEALKAREG
jgi:sn-glycerol 3-phosphate transport system substrate-binding protein